MTKDAVELKRVVEGTIEDIAELHTEVERKKALSVHNEKTADEYRDRLAENVRTVIQSVLDFNSGQTALHSELSDMVMAMKDQNQKDVRLKNNAFVRFLKYVLCVDMAVYSYTAAKHFTDVFLSFTVFCGFFFGGGLGVVCVGLYRQGTTSMAYLHSQVRLARCSTASHRTHERQSRH